MAEARDSRTLAVMPVLAVNWLVLDQAVSLSGLVLWVVGGSIAAWFLIKTTADAGLRVLTLTLVVALPVAFGALSNAIGGNTSGPLARATFIYAGLTGVACVIVATRYTRAVLLPLLAMLASGLALGATGSSYVWIGAWVVAAGFCLLLLGPYSESELIRGDRRRQVVGVLAGASLTGVVSGILYAAIFKNPWTIPGAGQVLDSSGTTPLPTTEPQPSPSQSASSIPISNGTETLGSALLHVLVFVLIALLILLALIAVIVLARVAYSKLTWMNRRNALHDDESARFDVMGAWQWAQLGLARYDRRMPIHVTPDTASLWAHEQGMDALSGLSQIVTPAAFNPRAQVSDDDRANAWDLADQVSVAASSGTPRQRLRWLMRTANRARLLHQRRA